MASNEVGTAYVNVMPKLSGVGAMTSQLGASLSGFAATGAKIVGAAMLGAAAGVGVFTKSVIDVGKEFDYSMHTVAATLGYTMDDLNDKSSAAAQNYQQLNEFAQKIGATTSFTATQAAEGLNYMALAGYSAADSMDMLPTVLNLATAGEIELGAASDMVTDAQTALGLSFEETKTMVDQMAAAASNTNTDVAQLGDAILTVGGTAKFMNGGLITLADGTQVTADRTTELNTVLGVLADNGIKGSEAGTHLRNALLKLGADDKTKAMMESLGVEVFDAEKKMRSFSELMPELSAAMADFTDEEKLAAFSEMFNVRDVATMNALLDTTPERWNEVGAAILDSAGAAQAFADQKFDNLEGDLITLGSAFDGVKIAIFSGLDPVLREFVQYGTAGLQGLTEKLKDPAIIASITEIADGIITGFTNAKNTIAEFGDGLFSNIDFEGFSTAFGLIGDTIAENFGDAGKNASAKDFGATLAEGINGLIPVIETAVPLIDAISQAVKFVADNSETAVPIIAALAGGFVALNIAQSLAPVISIVASSIGSIATRAVEAIAGLFGIAGAETAAGAAASTSASQIAASALAVIALGAGIALASAGMYVLASAAVMLADSGDGAVLVMGGLALAIAGLAAGAAVLGPALTAGALGIAAFGAAVLMVGAGVMLACMGISQLAGVLPLISAYGAPAAVAMMQLAPALTMLGVAALAAGAGAGVLGVALGVCAVAIAAAGAAAAILAIAVVGIGTGMLIAATAAQIMGAALPAIADNAGTAALGIGELAAASALAVPGLAAGAPAAAALAAAVVPLAAGSMAAALGILQIAAALPLISHYGAPAAVAILSLATAAGAAAPHLADAAPSMASLGSASTATASGLLLSVAALGALTASLNQAQVQSITTVAAFEKFGQTLHQQGAAVEQFTRTVQSNMQEAVHTVESAMRQIANAVNNTRLKMQPIDVGPLPHFSFSGVFDAETQQVPTLNVSWYAHGGIVKDAQLIGAGERGAELIWPSYSPYLSKYADAIASRIDNHEGEIIVNLNYTAGDDANDMVRDIARGIKQYRMAGVL